MRILCIIPARYKSSRFPGKPLADICGKPMIWWVYQQCLKVQAFTKVIVATDDDRIRKACEEWDMSCEMTSADNLTGTDRVAEVAERIEADLYVNVQGDEPLVSPQTIEKVLLPFTGSATDIDIVNLMAPIENPIDICNPTVVKVITNENGFGIYLTRAAAPHPKGSVSFQYYKQLGIYAFSREALSFFRNYGKTKGKAKIERIEDVEILRFIENGWNVQFLEADEPSAAVDTPQDLEKVIGLMKQLTAKHREVL